MKKTIIFLLSGVLAIASFNIPAIASVSVNFCEYYPLSVGNSWTYVDDFDKTYYTEIKGTERINGELTYQIQVAYVTDYAYVNFKCEAGIAKLVGFDGVPLESPIYEDGIDLETSENKVLYSIEPQVVTPAGTFTNVIKIERYDLNEKMGRLYLDQEEYLAKGVGTIKSVGYFVHDPVNPGSYENTYLLHSFDIKPTAKAMPWIPLLLLDVGDRFTDMGTGTIRDNNSGLIWLKDASCGDLPHTEYGRADWENANVAAAALNDGTCGLTDGSEEGDWRLPTKAEWEAFMSAVYKNPALVNTVGDAQWSEGDAFTGVQFDVYFYWSSTEYEDSGYAWCAKMRDGSMTWTFDPLTYYVWPVRSDN